MADRIEKEIEEILEKFDRMPGEGKRTPISIGSRRRRRRNPIRGLGNPLAALSDFLSPTALFFGGAAMVIGGLVLSGAFGGAIWVSFAGVCSFIAAFFWSFFRTPRPARSAPSGPSPGGGHFWRDRYIQYEKPSPGPADRLKRRFRRR